MGYADIADLRDEGFTDPPYSDPRCQTAIDRATAFIDLVTGWWFEPRAHVMLLDGRGHQNLHLSIPIIEVTKIETGGEPTWDDIDLDDVEIYNRHLSGQLHPDDRFNPRIVRDWDNYEPGYRFRRFLSYWPLGTKNVRVTGTFGFTDPDGSPTGKTPDMIRLACLLLARKELPLISDDDWEAEHTSGRVTQEKTRDQMIKLEKPYTYEKSGWPGGAVLTGDPQVDAILSRYRRPIVAKGV